MRKLKLQTQVSIDGFMAGPNGEMDFMVMDWDPALNQLVAEITEPVDCILLGRNLAEGFIPHWAAAAANPDDPEHLPGIKFTDTPKVVFSRTLEQSPWPNTEIASDLVEEIGRLKKQPGGDIIAYGGSAFVADLIKHDLVDEYNLLVNPTAIGRGKSIFHLLEGVRRLRLAQAQAFDCGIVALRYLVDRG